MTKLAHRIEKAITFIGQLSSWSMAILLVAIVAQVILRYGFNYTNTMLQDAQWYLFAMTMALGLSYTMAQDGHVRVDFLYQRFSPKVRKRIDILGIALFLLPLYGFLLWEGWQMTARSFAINESSPNPGGLPWMWLVKGLIPLSFFLFVIEALARLAILWSEPLVEQKPPPRHDT